MIWPMTTIQMSTSKKPTIGATYFMPRDTKIRRTVPSGTSAILDRKISRGRMTHVKNCE